MHLRQTAGILIVVVLVPVQIAAQTSTLGGITGSVRDPTGQAVVEARLQVRNLLTNEQYSASTNESGLYSFARLTTGAYEITAEKDGFKKAVREGITVRVNAISVADIDLVVGAVTETVSVSAEAPLVQSQSTEISTLIDERRVRELPLNGRNFQRLIFLAPGVGSGAGTGANPSINGARVGANSYSVDGASISNERLDTGTAGVYGASSDLGITEPNIISPDAIQEFRVITANADATFGRGSGAQINIVTRSGTNQLHASLYEYFRHDRLEARDFFNNGPFFNSDGSARVPPFKQNVFGGTAGGALRRDRTFLFGSYEGMRQRRRQQSAITRIVPNAALINLVPGDLGRFYRRFFIDRGAVPASGDPSGTFFPLSPADRSAAIASGFDPALFDGNSANGEAGTVQISAAPRRDIDQDAWLVRGDHLFSERFRATARYAFTPIDDLLGATSVERDQSEAHRGNHSATAQLTAVLSPSQIVEARGSLLRATFIAQNRGGIDPRLAEVGLGEEGLVLSIQGGFRTEFSAPFRDAHTIPQASFLHTWTNGSLTLRSGADLRWILINVANTAGARPSYTFAGFVGPNGILGSTPAQEQAVALSASVGAFGLNGGPTTPMRGYRSGIGEYFTQADWRLSPRVTLNAGLRYSYYGVYSEVNGALSNLYATGPGGTVDSKVSPFAFGRTANSVELVTSSRPFYQPDRNNFQPRLGLAWDVTGKGKTVVRTAYGIFHDRLFQASFTGIVNNLPYAGSSTAANAPFRLGVTTPINLNPVPSIVGIDPTLRNPTSHHVNVVAEQSLGSANVFSVGYVGTFGRGLIGQTAPNGFGGVPQNLRPDTRFGVQTIHANVSRSDYHSLQATARRRWKSGVDISVAYTFANSEDDASAESFLLLPSLINSGATPASGVQGGGSQFVSRPRSADWGRSSFAVPHYLVVSHLLELPFGSGRHFLDRGGLVDLVLGGWNLGGIATLRSGDPVNVTRGIDYNDDGDTSNDRPALVGSSLSSLYAESASGRTQYLVTQAEALQIANTPSDVTNPFAPIQRNV